ncbi:MAG: hypothetical protein PHG66_04780 [Candidatus Colwellbacteria bacterium]|nr:hypothetical protein [Candidatus Colwellbacteria bacterium]
MSLFDTEFVLCKRNYCSSHWSLETGFKSIEELDQRVREVRGLDNGGYMVSTTFFPTRAIYPGWVKSLQGRYYLWQTIKVD